VLRPFSLILCALAAGPVSAAQPAGILPLQEIRKGMACTGKTVFDGQKIEEFRCEILGVLENTGPRQSVILARLSGGPLEETGVMQGMSGSPVYVNGKLIGAVAYSFPFSKSPIAGIRPIEEMLAASAAPQAAERKALDPFDLAAALPARREIAVGSARLEEIATPLWLSGFSQSTLERFGPRLRAAGLEPVQGVGGGRPRASAGSPQPPQPGEMISVQLMTGDMNVGADGTVTYVEGTRVYAFGHRFLGAGETEMPFARAEVLALLPSLNSSFKISNPREQLGAITLDHSAAVAGELGRQARMLPLKIRVHGTQPARPAPYQLEMVNDRLLTPILVQMAVFSALEATERTAGVSTVSLRGRMLVRGGEPLPLSNVYASELGTPNLVAAAVAAPVAAILQSGFDSLKLAGVELDLEVSNEKRQVQLDGVWSSRRAVRPGESVDITALFLGESGVELARKATYQIPVGAPPGPLYFTVTDGPSANLAEFRQFLLTPPRSPEQLRDFLTRLHPNDRPYLRIWRATPTLQVQGENLPLLPPSMNAALLQSASQQANSLVAEIRMDPAPYLFSGSRTIQVEVKE